MDEGVVSAFFSLPVEIISGWKTTLHQFHQDARGPRQVPCCRILNRFDRFPGVRHGIDLGFALGLKPTAAPDKITNWLVPAPGAGIPQCFKLADMMIPLQEPDDTSQIR